jgi:hypothetical protein
MGSDQGSAVDTIIANLDLSFIVHGVLVNVIIHDIQTMSLININFAITSKNII